jgi:hypothetical protein
VEPSDSIVTPLSGGSASVNVTPSNSKKNGTGKGKNNIGLASVLTSYEQILRTFPHAKKLQNKFIKFPQNTSVLKGCSQNVAEMDTWGWFHQHLTHSF